MRSDEKLFLSAGVKDHKIMNYDSNTDISKKVMKICALIHKNKYLQKKIKHANTRTLQILSHFLQA